jgi:hypothetical protein
MAEEINGGILTRVKSIIHDCPVPDIKEYDIQLQDEWVCGTCGSTWICKLDVNDNLFLECVVRRMMISK